MSVLAPATPHVLAREEWAPLAEAHAERADAATAGHRSRAGRGERHAIDDFLYDYYSLRPGHLRRWHPGLGVVLEDALEHAGWKWYRTNTAGAHAGATSIDIGSFWAARGGAVRFVRDLLQRPAERPAQLGCFGLHEWAMVYRARDAERRHGLPLRLGAEATDAVVESHPVQCTHFDAFRFFTPEAVPLNAHALTRETQPQFEQPACLHANMDVFKWAQKLTPLVPGDLVLDAFELAVEIRRVDMQASPYDVSAFGLEAIAIETPAGKRRYADLQKGFAVRGNGIRERLVAICDGAERAASGR